MPDYQMENSVEHEHMEIDRYHNFSFHAHFHRDFEFFYVLDGGVDVIIDGCAEHAEKGDFGLIFSNQVHSFRTEKYSDVLVCPFSASYVGSFVRHVGKRVGMKSVFAGSSALKSFIEQCYLQGETPDSLTATASLYAVCAEFVKNVELVDTAMKDHELLYKVLNYVQENYREDVSLKRIARELGYDDSYLSRYFHRMIGMNFKRYVNQYRIEDACRRMEQENLRLSDVALECGFQSIRSFNRAFLELTGETPSQYLNKRMIDRN